jgi:hypothetical protein
MDAIGRVSGADLIIMNSIGYTERDGPSRSPHSERQAGRHRLPDHRQHRTVEACQRLPGKPLDLPSSKTYSGTELLKTASARPHWRALSLNAKAEVLVQVPSKGPPTSSSRGHARHQSSHCRDPSRPRHAQARRDVDSRAHSARVEATGPLRSGARSHGTSGGRAARIGTLEICMKPENGSTISRIRNRAADDESATSTSATADVGLTGENRQ